VLSARMMEARPGEDHWQLLNAVIAANLAYALFMEEAEQPGAWLDGLSNQERLRGSGLQSSPGLWLSSGGSRHRQERRVGDAAPKDSRVSPCIQAP
jgi:hypothetical protein